MASYILPVHKASTYIIATKCLTIDLTTKYPLTFLIYDPISMIPAMMIPIFIGSYKVRWCEGGVGGFTG